MGTFALIIFDLDGTLVDASPDLHTAVNETLAERHLPPRSLAEIHRFIGDGARELMLRALPDGQRDLVDELMPRYLEHYAAHIFDKTYAYPGVDQALTALSAKIKAVCSNKPERFTRQILDALGWSHHFGCVLGGDSLPVKKPDPRMLTAVCDAVHIPAERTVMVGDGPQDIAAAHAAGMACISVTWGFTPAEVLRQHGPDQLARSPAELVELIGRC